MPPQEGLPGLDSSLPFSPDPLDHLFLIIHGAGDPYVDHPPWMSSLENCLTNLDKYYALVTAQLRKSRRGPKTSPPTTMFLPVEWHRPAFETWQAEVRAAEPSPLGASGTVRAAVAETVGDVLMLASPFWRESIARHVAAQIKAQHAAVTRNRPAFSGRVSLVAHSVGGMIAMELLHRGLLDVPVDAVMLTGCPIAAYAALAPDGNQTALATIRKLGDSVRFINVFHPLDPVAFRLEPFVAPHDEPLLPPVRVAPQKRTFWDDASLFWDDVVYNLWSTLFPEGRGARVKKGSGIADIFRKFGGHVRGGSLAEVEKNGATSDQSAEKVEQSTDEKQTTESAKEESKDSESADTGRSGDDKRRAAAYMVMQMKGGAGGVGDYEAGGAEVLLNGRIDFELQDGMGVPPLDVMASWGAIKAHTYYWQCADVAQMLMDIAATSEEAMARRAERGSAKMWGADTAAARDLTTREEVGST